MKSLDIAIAGAGPGGLAAALFLHRAGHRVRIIKRFGAPQPVFDDALERYAAMRRWHVRLYQLLSPLKAIGLNPASMGEVR